MKEVHQADYLSTAYTYLVVSPSEGNNNVVCGVRFMNSVGQAPVAAEQVTQLRAVGFQCMAYRYRYGLEVIWENGRHKVFIDEPEQEKAEAKAIKDAKKADMEQALAKSRADFAELERLRAEAEARKRAEAAVFNQMMKEVQAEKAAKDKQEAEYLAAVAAVDAKRKPKADPDPEKKKRGRPKKDK